MASMTNQQVQQLLVVGLPLLLILSDLWTAFTLVPKQQHEQHLPVPEPLVVRQQQEHRIGGGSLNNDPTSVGGKFHISYCTSCSFKKAAIETKNKLETSFPGTTVLLSNYPPPTYKLMLSKIVPVIQFGGIGIALAGEHLFPRLGYAVPPAWYNTLRQNRFGAVATSWLIGNILQNALLNSGAFEIYYDGELVFSKLQEKRFPSDMELMDLIAKTLQRKSLS